MSGGEKLAEGVRLYPGDCLEVLATLEAGSIDACVTDPPYGLGFMGKQWDKFGATRDSGRSVLPGGGQKAVAWNASEFQRWCEAWSRQVFRVLKPGGHLLAFGGTRTYHRMVCAIEDAGFEIRDQIGWAYGSGFPKSHDVSKGIDKAAGAEREIVGRKVNLHSRGNHVMQEGWHRPWMDDPDAVDRGMMKTAPVTPAARQWDGFGTALKPAWEPIVLARKPLIGTVAENVLQHKTGALNIDGCRVEHTEECKPMAAQAAVNSIIQQSGRYEPTTELKPSGRWPANLVHDGSDEVLAAFPESNGCQPHNISSANAKYDGWGSITNKGGELVGYEGKGSAARFFYTAKADSSDRLGSKHPTVKPIDLMQWLVRLVTPPGGTVLDCFAGTGTTGEAAFREGLRAILIEREAEYQDDIRRRMALLLAGPEERSRQAMKAKLKDKPVDAGPLFGEMVL